MNELKAGYLLIIGGNEDKSGDCLILRKFIEMAGGREARLVIITTATEYPRQTGEEYRALLRTLGAKRVSVAPITERRAANGLVQAEEIERADGIFFTGGDQLRLTSILGGSLVDAAIRRAFVGGSVLAGTSAGASVMSDTMIIGGDSSDTPTKDSLSMAHGMSLLERTVVDQHFAQRGRINRLLAAVAQNPHVLGIGIDEDTALIVPPDGRCEIIGSQSVTILDGHDIVHSTISESKRHQPLAITNVTLHILPVGFGFDLKRRLPFICNV